MKVTVAVCMYIRQSADLLLIGLLTATYHELAKHALSMMVESCGGSDLCVGYCVRPHSVPGDDLFESAVHNGFCYMFVTTPFITTHGTAVPEDCVMPVENVCSMMSGNVRASPHCFRFTLCLCHAYHHCGRSIRDRSIHVTSSYAQCCSEDVARGAYT